MCDLPYTKGSLKKLCAWVVGFASDHAFAPRCPNLTVIHCVSHKLKLVVHDCYRVIFTYLLTQNSAADLSKRNRFASFCRFG